MSRFIDDECTTMSETCDVYLYVETMPDFGAAVAGAVVTAVARRAAAMVAVKAVRREIFTVVRLLL
jgi:hypothetical protein